tara:strand:- start:2339 stop:2545 length:207 start_codon:yes stop_codon:yes gene_type:complete
MIIDPFLNNPKTLYFKKFMSHPVNDEILENLFDEAYDYFSSNHPNWSEEKICYWAEKNAKRRFEEMST